MLQGLQDPAVILPAISALSLPLSLLCADADRMSPVWDKLQDLSEVHTRTGGLVVYTDGSLQRAGSAECCSGAGVVVMDGDRTACEVAIQLGGWMSSTKAEVYACIAALAALPLSQEVQVYTDSQGLMSGYRSFVTEASLQPFRHLLRNWFY